MPSIIVLIVPTFVALLTLLGPNAIVPALAPVSVSTETQTCIDCHD
jgi:hypothetical protein